MFRGIYKINPNNNFEISWLLLQIRALYLFDYIIISSYISTFPKNIFEFN